MEEIKFDTDFLNEFFMKKTGQEKFTIGDLRKIGYCSIDGNNEKITQHDLDILGSLQSVNLSKVNLNGLMLQHSNMDRLSLSQCDLSGVQILESKINSLKIDECIFDDDFIIGMKQLRDLKELELKGKVERDIQKIIKEHPNFNDLPRMEKYKIWTDDEYLIPEEFDISKLYELEDVQVLQIGQMKLKENAFENFGKFKNLKSIELGEHLKFDEKIEEIPEIRTLKSFTTYRGLENFNMIKNLTGINALTIYQQDRTVKNIELLKEFNNLTELTISKMPGFEKYLPQAQKLKKLGLYECNISDLSFLENYQSLERVYLDQNNLTEEHLADLQKLSERLEGLSFDDTPIANILKNKEISIQNLETLEEIKRIFGIYTLKQRPLTQYDVFCTKVEDAKIHKKDTLETLITTGLISKLKGTNIIKLENLEGLSEKILEYIVKEGKVKLKIKSFEGLTQNTLDILELNPEIQYLVEGDLATSEFDNTYYDLTDMKNILKVMETIKKSIPEDATDLQKFMSVYRAIGLSTDYDRSGCIDSEEYIEGSEKITRSLKGVLLEGRAVCVGYALALEKTLQYVGIEAKKINGYAYNNPELGHAWNQVKIDEKIYNTDLTWDYKKIRSGEKLEYCLKSDEEFYKDHTPGITEIIEKCQYDYSKDDIQKSLTDISSKTKENSENQGKGYFNLVSMKDYQDNAHTTTINPATIEEMKGILARPKEKSIESEYEK